MVSGCQEISHGNVIAYTFRLLLDYLQLFTYSSRATVDVLNL